MLSEICEVDYNITDALLLVYYFAAIMLMVRVGGGAIYNNVSANVNAAKMIKFSGIAEHNSIISVPIGSTFLYKLQPPFGVSRLSCREYISFLSLY